MEGYIRRRGKDSWQIIYELPRGADGKRKQGHQTVHGTKRDAEAKLRGVLTALDKGDYVTPSKETLGAFLERWLNTYAATRTSERTQQDYRSMVGRYLIPALGSVALSGLRPEHVQGLYADLRDRGLSATTVLHTHRLLKKALSHAVKWQLVARNICDVVDPPRPQRKEMVALDTDGVDRFLGVAKGSPFYDVFFVALYTGLRRSEALGLRWENVDMERTRFYIVTGLHRINSRGLVLLPTKTARSRRPVPFGEEVAELLRQIRGAQLVKQVELGPDGRTRGLYSLTYRDTPSTRIGSARHSPEWRKRLAFRGCGYTTCATPMSPLCFKLVRTPRSSANVWAMPASTSRWTLTATCCPVSRRKQFGGSPSSWEEGVNRDVAKMLPNGVAGGRKVSDRSYLNQI